MPDGSERVGTFLRDKYRLDAVLGSGGMAVVYAATHRNSKRFAVKVLHPELSRREDMRKRFLREGYLANTVDHAGAVAMLDEDIADDGSAFLVMELLTGMTVEELSDRSDKRLSVRVVLAILHELLDVLAAAHAKSIVHRDIKPGNLFVTGDGSLKVLDFGIARLKESADAKSTTSTGAMLGTPAFMAPEQALAEFAKIDARTDLWAAGATAFSLLSGRAVHEATNSQQVVIYSATRPARSLAEAAPTLDARVTSLVDRALAFEMDQRWQSASEMRAFVEGLYNELFGAPVSRDVLASALAAAKASEAPPPRTTPTGAPDLGSAPTIPSVRPALPGTATLGGAATKVQTSPGPMATAGRPASRLSPMVIGSAIGGVLLLLSGFALRGVVWPATPPAASSDSAHGSLAATTAAVPSVPVATATASASVVASSDAAGVDTKSEAVGVDGSAPRPPARIPPAAPILAHSSGKVPDRPHLETKARPASLSPSRPPATATAAPSPSFDPASIR